MPNPGEIFVCRNFTFEDGSQKDKLFVVLNICDFETPCLVLKTTSKSKRYEDCVKGCNKKRKCFFTPATWQTCFKVDTYIQLPQILEFRADELFKDKFKGKIEFICSLTPDCFAQLKMCLAGFKDDIPRVHWDLIFKGKN